MIDHQPYGEGHRWGVRAVFPRFPAVAPIFASIALWCLPLSLSLGQPTQENPFDQFDVAWQDSCPAVDDDSWCKFTIWITGRITPRTVARFEKGLAHAEGRQRLLITLNSQGGDLASAMRIGRLLRNAQGRTIVEKDATCASACVFIFAAGLSRIIDMPHIERPTPGLYASGFPSPPAFDPSKRFEIATPKPAAIGIHRPALAGVPTQTDMPAVKAAADEDERELRKYAAEMNISQRLIDDMVAIPPEQVRWLSENDLKSYGLGFLDPVYAEAASITESKKYEITPAEYRSRNGKALSACGKLLTTDDRYGFLESPHRSQCVVDIISGKLTPPPAGFVIEPPYHSEPASEGGAKRN
jgi:hypothetical protein